jgi:hypothetical protein
MHGRIRVSIKGLKGVIIMIMYNRLYAFSFFPIAKSGISDVLVWRCLEQIVDALYLTVVSDIMPIDDIYALLQTI